MEAVAEGRASRAKRRNKPRTIKDKQEIFDRDIRPTLGKKSIYDITEKDLIDLVVRKGKRARTFAFQKTAERGSWASMRSSGSCGRWPRRKCAISGAA
jgi:cytidylate kinase